MTLQKGTTVSRGCSRQTGESPDTNDLATLFTSGESPDLQKPSLANSKSEHIHG